MSRVVLLTMMSYIDAFVEVPEDWNASEYWHRHYRKKPLAPELRELVEDKAESFELVSMLERKDQPTTHVWNPEAQRIVRK